MQNLFVPYEISNLLKEKGFKQNVFGEWVEYRGHFRRVEVRIFQDVFDLSFPDDEQFDVLCIAPLYQQTIDWLEDKHDKYVYAFKYDGIWQWKVDAEHGCDEFSKGEGYLTKYEALDDAIIRTLNLI